MYSNSELLELALALIMVLVLGGCLGHLHFLIPISKWDKSLAVPDIRYEFKYVLLYYLKWFVRHASHPVKIHSISRDLSQFPDSLKQSWMHSNMV